MNTPESSWQRFSRLWFASRDLGMTLDISRADLPADYLAQMTPTLVRAVAAMHALEAGALANADERRMVGHYWLRAPRTAPTSTIRCGITKTLARVEALADAVHTGALAGAHGRFEHLVHVGIGGSALGPQLVVEALARSGDPMQVHFLDNADPDGIDRLLARLDGALGRTLVSVVSKCGHTPTPWHVMLELEAAYERAGLDFARHAVATTMAGTNLDARAESHGWLARFPIWEWVGGRTSVTSAVGLLPLALQGTHVRAFLGGAAAMDELTRSFEVRQNPAALLALAWFWQARGHGQRNMVVLPYRDRLALFPRYVQQLVMESIGKKLNRKGEHVAQGLTVYGNKGSTDQHAYVQQLRDGPPDFFVTFVRVHDDRRDPDLEVEPGATLDDFLFGYLENSRDALHARGRGSITLALPRVDARSLGALVALYERSVGIYAELVDVNAYHQPGVEKNGADAIVALQRAVLAELRRSSSPLSAEQLASAIGQPERVETVFKLLEHLARSPGRGVEADGEADAWRWPPHLRFRATGASANAPLHEPPEQEQEPEPQSPDGDRRSGVEVAGSHGVTAFRARAGSG